MMTMMATTIMIVLKGAIKDLYHLLTAQRLYPARTLEWQGRNRL